MIKHKLLLWLFCLGAALTAYGQSVDIDPEISPKFFRPSDEITITYDVTGTPLQSLDDAWIWVWIPNANVDAPSNVNPAQSNTSATDPAKMTRSVGNNGEVLFSITLTPNDFFASPVDGEATMGMLLKGNDWPNGQTTDHLNDFTYGFTVELRQPEGSFGFYEPDDIIEIEALTSETADIAIRIDDNTVASTTATTSISHAHTVINDNEVHVITINADNGSEIKTVTYTYAISPTTEEAPLPAGVVDGINYHADSTSATLVLTAPNKDNVFVIGTFNDWSLDQQYLMKRDGDQYWLTVEGLEQGREYQFQYLVDGEIRIADPYAEKIGSGFDDPQIISEGRYPGLMPYPAGKTSEMVGYLQTGKPQFAWANFERPAEEDLIIYELLVRDFTEERTYKAVIERLDYLESLGINALQLMPVMEFEGNISWGYNPAAMFAVDKYYGTELDLKTLINECHKRGMAVIFDIVLNHHFGRASLVRLYNDGLYGAPTAENPWFNRVAKHDFNVGYDMNHDNPLTREYSKRVIAYWLEEYNIDGYRFDLSKGFTQKNTLGNVGAWGQYDADRVALWKEYADYMWSVSPGSYVILEHFANNDEEKELAEYGMMLWGNMNHTYRQAGKGSATSMGSMYHGNRGWNVPHLIGYMESHDEERVMWDLLNSMDENEALERAKLLTPFVLLVPGPKMLWQFGEFGYDEELNNDRLGIKPTRWEYLNDPRRQLLHKLYTSLINLRTKTDFVRSEGFAWNTGGWIKTMNLTHPEVDIYVAGNFNDESETANHKFPNTGTWYDYFTGEEIDVTQTDAEFSLEPGQFFIYTSQPIDNFIEDGVISRLEDNIEKSSVRIYPNPATNHIRISIEGWAWGELTVRDVTGKALLVQQYEAGEHLDVSGLAPGTYLIELKGENGRVSRRFVKR